MTAAARPTDAELDALVLDRAEHVLRNTLYPTEADAIAALRRERDALREACQAAIAYDAAIQSCANDPKKMSSYTTAQDDTLDDLYMEWITKARECLAAPQKEKE